MILGGYRRSMNDLSETKQHDYGIPRASDIPMTYRHYLVVKAMQDQDTGIMDAVEYVTAFTQDHPELDLEEERTYGAWEADQSA